MTFDFGKLTLTPSIVDFGVILPECSERPKFWHYLLYFTKRSSSSNSIAKWSKQIPIPSHSTYHWGLQYHFGTYFLHIHTKINLPFFLTPNSELIITSSTLATLSTHESTL